LEFERHEIVAGVVRCKYPIARILALCLIMLNKHKIYTIK
jgi:hypothetical protein